MNHVAIISSVYGHYDQPAPIPEQSIPTECILVTDGDYQIPSGWHEVVEPRPHLHPRLAAKVPKCLPDHYTDAGIAIWIDASFEIKSPHFAQWCIEHLGDADIAQFKHPDRGCIAEEVEAAIVMPKYEGQRIREQAGYYLSRGHPLKYGLWTTGLMVRRIKNDAFGSQWLAEQLTWTLQDQISEPYLLRLFGYQMAEMPAPFYGNEMFEIRGHAHDL